MNRENHSNYSKVQVSQRIPQPIKPKQNEKELVFPTDDFCHCVFPDKWLQERWIT